MFRGCSPPRVIANWPRKLTSKYHQSARSGLLRESSTPLALTLMIVSSLVLPRDPNVAFVPQSRGRCFRFADFQAVFWGSEGFKGGSFHGIA